MSDLRGLVDLGPFLDLLIAMHKRQVTKTEAHELLIHICLTHRTHLPSGFIDAANALEDA